MVVGTCTMVVPLISQPLYASNRYMTFVTTWKRSSPSPAQTPRYPDDGHSDFSEGFPARYWLPAFFFPQGDYENHAVCAQAPHCWPPFSSSPA